MSHANRRSESRKDRENVFAGGSVRTPAVPGQPSLTSVASRLRCPMAAVIEMDRYGPATA
jgi:hypothetical protein